MPDKFQEWKICILDHPQTHGPREVRRSRAIYITLLNDAKLNHLCKNAIFHHIPNVGPKQLCALMYLRNTNKAGNSLYLLNQVYHNHFSEDSETYKKPGTIKVIPVLPSFSKLLKCQRHDWKLNSFCTNWILKFGN